MGSSCRLDSDKIYTENLDYLTNCFKITILPNDKIITTCHKSDPVKRGHK